MRNEKLQEKIMVYEKDIPFRIEHTVQTLPRRILKTHWHDYLELVYFKKGGSTAMVEQKHYHLEQNDTMIANPYELHTLDQVEANSEYYVIIIECAFLKSNYLSGNVLFQSRAANDRKIGEILSNVYQEYQRKEVGFDFKIKGQIYLLYSHLLKNYIVSDEDKSSQLDKSNKSRNYSRLKIVLEYIEMNYMNDISFDYLVSLLNVSKSYFTHLFTETMNVSVTDYIISVRMQKAYDILKSTELNVSQTAAYLGFSDMNYFSRLFKKYYGYPPSEIIKEHK